MNLMPLPTELGGGPLGSVVYPVQDAQCVESVTSTRAHRFDLATRTWSRYTSNHLSSLNSALGGHDAPSVYDPTAKRIWQLPIQIHSTQNIGYIDLTEPSPQWRLSASWSWPPTWDGTQSAWLDDSRRLILMQSPTRLVALDLNNLAAGPKLLNFSGTLPPSGNRWEFYPPDGSFYNKGNTGNEIWKLTPPSGDPITGTWAISSFTVTGATLPDISAAAQLYGARHFTRFFYVPAIASFAWIADSYSPVMLIRPPTSGTPAIPTVSISATPSTITTGAATTLGWSSTDATSCTASGAWSGARATAGAELVSALSVTSTFTITCTGTGGSASQSVTVTVTSGTPVPTVSLSASPISVSSGGSSILTWSSTNATSCTASGAWSGSKATSGSQSTGALNTSNTYTLSCSGSGGNASQSVTVSVGTPPPAGLITSVNLINNSGSNQINVPVTFGHAFKQGDVPAGYTVMAKDAAGSVVPLQVDKKATHADGSLRHAILTAKLATLDAAATQSLSLITQADSASPSPVTLASLLATTFDSQVSLNVAGTIYSASARNLLQTTTPKSWLSGAEVSEWIVGGPVKTAGGVAHPHLTAYFHVRAYAGTPITQVRVDAVVENNWTLVPSPQDFIYVPTVTIGDTTIYNNGGLSLTHYQHARWHQVGWWNNTDSKIYAKLDVTYLQDTRAIPKYETLTPTEAFLSSVRQSTPPMDNGDQPDYMPSGGAADSIGPLPRWDAVFAVSGDRRAFNYMLANADGGAAYGSHFRDEITKLPVTIDSYPNSSLGDPSGSSPVIPEGPSANPYVYDGAHQPSVGYTAYLVTGDYFYLEEMQFWSANNLIATGSYARGGSSAYIAAAATNGSTGIWYTGSLRGQAWAYRSLLQAASITPDTHELKNYFSTKLNNNLAYDKWQYVDANSAESNGLGMMYQAGRNDPGSSIYGEYRMWFDHFISWAYQYAVELGFSNAIPMRDYKAKTVVGMMGLAANESCFQFVPQYISHVGPLSPSPIYYATFKEVYDATAPGATAHVCGSQDMANYLTSIGNHTYVINEMTGGQTATDYYFAVMQPALAAAVDSGLAGGLTAWSRSQLSGVHPDYRDQPIWAIIPRSN